MLEGSRIISEQWGNHHIVYVYDESGAPVGMYYRTNSYAEGTFDVFYFEKNLQGDIIGVYNSSGTLLALYDYDAWGNCTAQYASGATSTGVVYNPFRYRGYYYDTDLGLYYLNSRYYDANTGRFINADGQLNGALLGNNQFAYCENNPITRTDYDGEMWQAVPALDPRCKTFGSSKGSFYGGTYSGKVSVSGRAAVNGGIMGLLIYALFNGTADLYTPQANVKENEKESVKEKTTAHITSYYGVIITDRNFEIVTSSMSLEEAYCWVQSLSTIGNLGRNRPWGLYTDNSNDAFIMAGLLGKHPEPIHEIGNASKNFPHYHTYGRNFGRYKHFHIWYSRTGG